MALLGRKGPAQSIDERLHKTFRERQCILDSFTDAELGLVQSRAPGGLARVEQVPATASADTEQARHRLEQAGYLRKGAPRPKEPIRDRVPAVLRSDRSPVTLLGDYAIVHALRSHPDTLAEVRTHDAAGHLETESRLYIGVGPSVMLQEMPGADGRLGFVLYEAEAGLIGLARVCGVRVEDLQTMPTPPARVVLAADDARGGWTQSVEVRVARPSGDEVTLTTILVGLGPDGLWMVELAEDPGTATWTEPNGVGERLAALLSPSAGCVSWLPTAGADE